MRRREFISFLGGAAAWPAVVRAQVSTKRPLIVWLSGGGQSASQVFVDAFLKGMRELGYVERSNFDIVYRYADGYVERLPPLAEELVRLHPNVILAPASGPAVAAKNATSSIPIVTPALADAVHLGLIASESRPGGNVTGIAPYVAGLPAKQMELAREVVPGAVKIGVLTNLEDPKAPPQWQELESAGQGLGVKVVASDVRTPDDLEAAIKVLAREGINVMIVLQTSMLLTERRRLAALAATARIPAVYGYREHVDDGGLASYGVDLRECFHRGAYFVDKIPKGASPSDLPDGDELPSAAAQPSVKNETLLAGKDSSAGVTAPKATSVPTGQPSITSETTGGRGVRDYLWGAAFIVMIMWLLIVLFGKTLIRGVG